MKVSVILPAYNEEKRILKTLDTIYSYMEATFSDYEIIVVDDGSKDRTYQILQEYGRDRLVPYTYQPNRGKGGAVTYGMTKATGDIVIFTDADLPYPVENIGRAVQQFEETDCDLLLGKRRQTKNGQKYPWYRTLMSKCFSIVVNLILGLHVADTQCGFKCFRKAAAKQIFSKATLTGWGFDVEVIFIAKKKHLKIGRIEVELFHENEDSKINAASDAVTMFREVLQVRKNNKEGRYQ